MFMENKDPKLWSSAHIYRSQWLQTTISDLDEKMEAMVTILGGKSSQGHMHCKWREDMLHMLEEFGQSYRVLAIAYSQLKSKTSHGTFHSGSIASTTSKTMCVSCKRRATSNLDDKKLEKGSNSHLRSLAEHFDVKSDGTNLDFDLLKRREDDYDELSSGQCSMKLKSELEHSDTQIKDRKTDFSTNENILMKIEGLELNQRIEDPPMINSKINSTWPVLKYQMAKLTGDNLHQLVELVRRNDEKRETIRRLRLEVETLKRENKALQRHSNDDLECNQSQISRLGEIYIGKHFRGCSR